MKNQVAGIRYFASLQRIARLYGSDIFTLVPKWIRVKIRFKVTCHVFFRESKLSGEHPDKSIMKTNSSCEVELKLMPLYIILIFMEHLNVNSNYNFGWDADGAPAAEDSIPRGRCAIGSNSG